VDYWNYTPGAAELKKRGCEFSIVGVLGGWPQFHSGVEFDLELGFDFGFRRGVAELLTRYPPSLATYRAGPGHPVTD
jgi:hypothetical protein